MSLNVMAKLQLVQLQSAEGAGAAAEAKRAGAREDRVEAIGEMKEAKLEAIEQQKKANRKGTTGLLIGAAVAVAVVAASIALPGIGTAAVIGIAVAATALMPAGKAMGHDVAGAVNKKMAAVAHLSSGKSDIALTEAKDRADDAGERVSDAIAQVDQVERFSRQIRADQRSLSEGEA